MPVGTILPYVGDLSKIPHGWFLCDGSNGTPDLRDRFITGAGLSYNLHDIGGENYHQLNINEMPAHNHWSGVADARGYLGYFRGRSNMVCYGAPGPSSTLGYETASGAFEVVERGLRSEGDASNNYTEYIIGLNANKLMSSLGNNYPHENRPPYYAVYYIIRMM